MELSPRHKRIAVLAIVKEASGLFGGLTKNFNADLESCEGSLYQECPKFKARAEKILQNMEGFKNVKASFKLDDAGSDVVPLVSKLQTAREKWEQVGDHLSQVPGSKQTRYWKWFWRWYYSEQVIPKDYSGNKNVFKTSKPELFALIKEAGDLFNGTEASAHELLEKE